ncbi:MAG: hypothetical protein K9M44_02975 [Candidatus Pacebacteria bacterium]|nr:hypothetical protein [Candidatus Paceibacterota bacterium]
MEHKKVLKEFTVTDGRKIMLDICDKSCEPFGFRPGDKIMTSSDLIATVRGLGPSNDGDLALFYELERVPGKVCYFGGCRDLRKAGFRKIEDEA